VLVVNRCGDELGTDGVGNCPCVVYFLGRCWGVLRGAKWGSGAYGERNEPWRGRSVQGDAVPVVLSVSWDRYVVYYIKVAARAPVYSRSFS